MFDITNNARGLEGCGPCLHAQGSTDCHFWGQEGIFLQGRLARDSGGFLPSSGHPAGVTC